MTNRLGTALAVSVAVGVAAGLSPFHEALSSFHAPIHHPHGRAFGIIRPQPPVSVIGPQGFRPETLKMVSGTIGWAWSLHHLWWTQDGGRQWVNVTPSGLPKSGLYGVFSVGGLVVGGLSGNRAWVGAEDEGSASDPGPNYPIWYTNTHGRTWHRVPVPDSHVMGRIIFLTPRVGWLSAEMAGAAGSETMVIEATHNGGRTWYTLPSSITPAMVESGRLPPVRAHAIPFFGDKAMTWSTPATGWITGTQGGKPLLLRSNDGGRRWFPRPISHRAGQHLSFISSPEFFGGHDGVMAVTVTTSGAQAVYRTRDGGRKWIEGSTLPASIQQVDFGSYRDGLALGTTSNAHGVITTAVLYRTPDSGRRWFRLNPSGLPLRQNVSLDMISGQVGFALTSDPAAPLWKTTTGGTSWEPVPVLR